MESDIGGIDQFCEICSESRIGSTDKLIGKLSGIRAYSPHYSWPFSNEAKK
jgi:hypothetical protein